MRFMIRNAGYAALSRRAGQIARDTRIIDAGRSAIHRTLKVLPCSRRKSARVTRRLQVAAVEENISLLLAGGGGREEAGYGRKRLRTSLINFPKSLVERTEVNRPVARR